MESYLKDFLKEDLTPTDLTANLVPNQYTEAKIYAKDSGILAGNHFAVQTFKILGNVECRELLSDGSKVDFSAPKGEKSDILNFCRSG